MYNSRLPRVSSGREVWTSSSDLLPLPGRRLPASPEIDIMAFLPLGRRNGLTLEKKTFTLDANGGKSKEVCKIADYVDDV